MTAMDLAEQDASMPLVVPADVAPARGVAALVALVRACRPRQWIKNLLVLAAPGAAGVLANPEVPGKLLVTFVCFCALASATYLINDVRDLNEDRAHPRRRTRPLASGEVAPRTAIVTALLLAGGALIVAFALKPWLGAVAVAYLALTLSYTLWWRSVAVADLAAVSGGFVLRALAGGAATSVTVSRWFLLVTSFGALFLVAGKRYAELRASDEGGILTRASLGEYSERYLRFVLGLSATVATTAYCLWAFQRSHQSRLTWYELTVVPFVMWLLRYALLLDRGEGEQPEVLLLRDRFLITMSTAWLGLFVSGVYVVG